MSRCCGSADVLKGRFELVRELSAGGMGKVFQALDRLKVEAEDHPPYVAIKVVSRAFGRDRRTPTVPQFLADLTAPADRRLYVLGTSVAAVLVLGIGGALVHRFHETDRL